MHNYYVLVGKIHSNVKEGYIMYNIKVLQLLRSIWDAWRDLFKMYIFVSYIRDRWCNYVKNFHKEMYKFT